MPSHRVLQSYFSKYHLNAILISDLHNVRYLSGFTGTNGLILITLNRGYFFTDFRYTEQAKKQVTNFTILESHRDIGATIIEFLNKNNITKLGFEAEAFTYSQFIRLEKSLHGITLIPVTEDPAKLREIKTAGEIKKITKALAINKLAFDETRTMIRPGVREVEIKRYIEIAMIQHGAEKIAFDTIVASGGRGALPHGVASNKKIKNGELVTIDFGCVVDGYNSDETVTISQGTINKKQRTIHQIVFDAQQYAIEAAKPGVKCSDIDKAAREYIEKKGYGKYFGHALGHGVGLEVHERPMLSLNSTDILEEGMVFTIEPGIYIPKFGGVRIEDVFGCTKNGTKKLSQINKKI